MKQEANSSAMLFSNSYSIKVKEQKFDLKDIQLEYSIVHTIKAPSPGNQQPAIVPKSQLRTPPQTKHTPVHNNPEKVQIFSKKSLSEGIINNAEKFQISSKSNLQEDIIKKVNLQEVDLAQPIEVNFYMKCLFGIMIVILGILSAFIANKFKNRPKKHSSKENSSLMQIGQEEHQDFSNVYDTL